MAVLETLRTEGPRFLDPSVPWEHGAAVLVGNVVAGLETALRDPQTSTLRSPLSRPQLVQFARIFIEQAAQIPGIVAGNRPELRMLVTAVAQIMGGDVAQRVLSPQDWLAVTEVAARKRWPIRSASSPRPTAASRRRARS